MTTYDYILEQRRSQIAQARERMSREATMARVERRNGDRNQVSFLVASFYAKVLSYFSELLSGLADARRRWLSASSKFILLLPLLQVEEKWYHSICKCRTQKAPVSNMVSPASEERVSKVSEGNFATYLSPGSDFRLRSPDLRTDQAD